MIDILALSQSSFNPINREIYRRIEKSGFSIELVVPSYLIFPSGKKNAYPKEEQDPPINFLELKGSNPRIQVYDELIPLLTLKQPKLIFLDFDPASLLAVKVGKWCAKNNSKLICLSVENLPLDIFSAYKRRGWRSITPTIIKNIFIKIGRKNVSHVFNLNNDGLEIFNNLDYKSCSKTPLGFNESIFNDSPEKRKKIRTSLNLEHTTIAYFGRTIPEKGIHILLYALKKIEHLPWNFIMDEFDEYKNSYSNELNNIIDDLNLRDRITFIHANHVEIADYMNASDIVVVPSISSPKWKEQYGRVAPEAMACKNAVIVSNSGALPELVESSALIFEEGNIDELSGLLEKLINSTPLVDEYKDKGYHHAQNKLGLISQLKVYNNKFNELLK